MLVLLNSVDSSAGPNQESAKSPILALYSSLIATVRKYVEVPDPELKIADRRLRGKQLRAQDALLRLARHFWIADDPDNPFPCPRDVLENCRQFAEDLYTAAALAFTDYLSDESSVEAFLDSDKDWVIDQILPREQDRKPLTIRFDEALGDFQRRTMPLAPEDFIWEGDLETFFAATLNTAPLEHWAVDRGEWRISAPHLISSFRIPSNRSTAVQILSGWLRELDRTILADWGDRLIHRLENGEVIKPTPMAPLAPECEQSVTDAKPAEESTVSVPRFPNRAKWLAAKLAERGWNKHDLKHHGGPEHRTTQKLLEGSNVQEDVLRRV